MNCAIKANQEGVFSYLNALLQEALKRSGGSKFKLSVGIDVRYATVCSWFRQCSTPTLQHIERLERYVNHTNR